MFCPNCGKEISDAAAFCPECGNKFMSNGSMSGMSDDGCLHKPDDKKNDNIKLKQRKSRTRSSSQLKKAFIIIIPITVIVLAAIITITCFIVNDQNEKKAASEEAARIEQEAKEKEEQAKKEQEAKEKKEQEEKAAKEQETANKKAQFQNGFITGDYVLSTDSTIIFHLDIENRHYTIKKSGVLQEEGRVLTEAPNTGMQVPGYWTSYIFIAAKSGMNHCKKTSDGFEISYGSQVNASGATTYNVDCKYLLM